ncbi:hypothetical protein SCLARK_0021 [Spiroplasma clarkii]|nr:hypothetical protein [Spiroplasma clarkii]ARU90856.1 hypothetical protein SCLARK_0021 [Spiroplasma clarkii]
MYYDALSDEANTIRGKIVERMHRYHNNLLNGEIEKGNPQEFKEQVQSLKTKIQTVYQQAGQWIDDTIKELQISFGFIKTTFKWSVLNTVYFKFLQAMYLKKDNLVFSDIFSKLSNSEAQELLQATEILKNCQTKTSVIFLEDELSNVPKLEKPIYLLSAGQIVPKTLGEIIIQHWDDFGAKFLAGKNKIKYTYENKHLKIGDKKMKIEDFELEPAGVLVLDPSKLYLSKKDFKGDYISIEVTETKIKNYLDKNLRSFIDQQGNKYLVLSSEPVDKKIKIYITKAALLKFN